jgi:DNA gyrase subunit B
MRPLVDNGHIFIAQPPLYKLKVGKNETYLFSDDAKNKAIAELPPTAKFEVSRYKGLGEMNAEELADTTMKPEQRILKQCKIEDGLFADQIFSMLMGEEVLPRRRFIEENAYKVMDKLDV